MASFVYQGTAFKQALDPTAPWMFSFVGKAEELLMWAGIPKRTENSLGGFQRLEDEPRVERAKSFFQQYGQNQSPTSLVLGIHSIKGTGVKATLKFLGPPSDSIRAAELTIEYDEKESLEQAVARLREQIEFRLGAEPEVTEEDQLEEAAVEEEEAANEEADAEGDDGEGSAVVVDEEIELGRSLLKDLLQKLSDADWCQQYEADIRDFAKPATIIDGQHRIQGARACERGIPFSAIAIFECTWAEQVFQFTVVNYTAKGIPDQFITANAALSLTGGELQALEQRLQQAGVKVIEYELMSVINFDNESPFKELVNLSQKKDEARIGYKTMVQVGKAWYSAREMAVRQVINNIYPDITGKKPVVAGLRLQAWKAEHWGLFFKDFWSVIRDHYDGEKTDKGQPLWSVGSNLLIAVVLLQLQEEFFRNLRAQDDDYFAVSAEDPVGEMRAKIKKRAKIFIGYFKPDFFAREWKSKSLSIGPGRAALRECFQSIVDSKGNYQYGKSTLITGKTSSAA